jgi:hypothetical protein
MGCGGTTREPSAGARGVRPPSQLQPAAAGSTIEAAANDLLPGSVTPSGRTRVGRCYTTFNRTTRCATLLARGGGPSLASREQAYGAAARSRGWRLTHREGKRGASTAFVFQRGGLEGRVLLAGGADLAIVIVKEQAPAVTDDEAQFIAAGRTACARLAVAMERIPRSLSRDDGLRRVRMTWRTFIADIERLTPPPPLRDRHRKFAAALRAFERALWTQRPDHAADAAKSIARRAQAVGLPKCIPSR